MYRTFKVIVRTLTFIQSEEQEHPKIIAAIQEGNEGRLGQGVEVEICQLLDIF